MFGPIDKAKEDIALSYASGKEEFTQINADESKLVPQGEIVYKSNCTFPFSEI